MKPERPEDPSNLPTETGAIAPAAGSRAEEQAPIARAEEPELVARAQARDAGAFRLLVERHRDGAYALALRIVRSPADAEEVAQDAFVRAWLALPRFRGEARFSTWLHRIVARLAFDRAAMLRRRRARETDVEVEEGAPERGALREGDEARLRTRRMESLIAGLSEAQRAAVTLYYYEGRSVEHVALALGMPTGTVKTHLSRARSAFRQAWLRVERAG